jgi:hypothetical protein
MSNQVDKAMVDEFNAGFMHLSQQMECRFSGKVREETQNSESQFWDQLSPTVAQKKTGRHSDTPLIHTPHDRRRCTLEDYEWADLVDKADKIRMISDPAGDYLKAAVAAMNRAKDDVIIREFSATAYTGRSGGTAVELTTDNVLVATDGTAAGADSVQYLNEYTLRLAAQHFDELEAANDGDSKYIAVNAANLYQGLLGENTITNNDFNVVKALVRGEVNSFMGFEFIRTERLTDLSQLTGKARYTGLDNASDYNITTGRIDLSAGTGGIASANCVVLPAWVKSGMLKAQGAEIETRITERSDKSYSIQPFASMSIGASRMEEAKCLEIVAQKG